MKFVLIALQSRIEAETISACFDTSWNLELEESPAEFLKRLSLKKFDYVFVDVEYLESVRNGQNYKMALKPFWKLSPDTEIIVLAPQNRIREAVEYVKSGASDYLSAPVLKEDVQYVVDRLEQKAKLLSELQYLRDAQWNESGNFLLRTNSDGMKKILSDVRSVAQTDSTVLITGDTGTGKGVIARLIHQYSPRNDRQFIGIHCGAITDSLLESELFGHEKGAFTGAIRRKLGKFEIAHGGTIFLDEIGTISSNMQVKLLQVLQDRTFYRVGGEVELKADVRIIAATNANLAQLSENGSFRADLYYRLNVFQIEMPPLRERKDDLAQLALHILNKLNQNNTKNIKHIDPEVIQAFLEYDWPGNIRELENLLERAYILEQTDTLTPNSFPIKLFKDKLKKYLPPVDITKTLSQVRTDEVSRVEYEYLKNLLSRNKGKIKKTAQDAGISERQLHNLLSKYNLDKNKYK